MINPVKAIRERLRTRDAYQTLFASDNPAVRDASDQVMRDLFRVAYITKSPFVPNDPHSTARNLGAQRLLIHILNQIHNNKEEIIRKIHAQYEENSF